MADICSGYLLGYAEFISSWLEDMGTSGARGPDTKIFAIKKCPSGALVCLTNI